MMPQPKKAAMLGVWSVVLTLPMLAAYQESKPQGNSNYNGLDLVDKTGNILKPTDYRDRYQAFSAFFVRDPIGAEEMHYTYAPGKQVATDYKKDCLGCHIPAKATDWVYVQGYPVLSSK